MVAVTVWVLVLFEVSLGVEVDVDVGVEDVRPVSVFGEVFSESVDDVFSPHAPIPKMSAKISKVGLRRSTIGRSNL